MRQHDRAFGRSRRGRCWRTAKRGILLDRQRAAALPKSPLGAATGYALRNWAALTRYTEDGRLKIDNNGARSRRYDRSRWAGENYGCSRAVKRQRSRTAILCSLVQTCKHLQINPFIYLRDVIERVSSPSGATGPGTGTPREWKRLRQRLRRPSRRPSRRLNGGLLIIQAAPPAGFIDLNLRIDRYTPTTFFAIIDRWTNRWRWSW